MRRPAALLCAIPVAVLAAPAAGRAAAPAVAARVPFATNIAFGPDGRLYVTLLISGKVLRYPAGV